MSIEFIPIDDEVRALVAGRVHYLNDPEIIVETCIGDHEFISGELLDILRGYAASEALTDEFNETIR